MDIFQILLLIATYFIGAIPSAYLMGKIWGGIDIREHGSGNVGFTNALRVLGRIPGVLTLIIDISKGLVPVLIAKNISVGLDSIHPLLPEIYAALAGMIAISGHMYSIYIRFKGGKGIATGCGVFLALVPLATGSAFVVWITLLLLFKIVSISSIVGVTSVPIFMMLYHYSPAYIVMGLIMACVTIVKHCANIKRLIQGTEPKISSKKS